MVVKAYKSVENHFKHLLYQVILLIALKSVKPAESTNHFGTLVISAIHGLGGIGKTILAQALAHDPQVQEHFCDGILWTTLGQQPDVLALLQAWIQALRDYDFKPTTIQAASNHLNSLLYDNTDDKAEEIKKEFVKRVFRGK